MSVAFLFPGQGSQAPGMGKALAEADSAAADVFERVDDALGEKLSETLWTGTAEELTMTRVAQPGLMTVSMAALASLKRELGGLPPSVAYFAGHSLGEYSALAAAGSLELPEAARLLRLRGEAMQRAVPPGEGTMAAIIGLEADKLRELTNVAAEGEVCQIANDNGGGQIVISGHKNAVERAMLLAKEAGAKRAIPLPVSAPFHSVLMQPAADEMRTALAASEIRSPSVPVIANVSAEPHSDTAGIRESLVAQVTGTVRWRESIVWLFEHGVTQFVELGPGKVLSGLAKRIVPGVEAMSAGAPEDIERLAEMLGE